MTDKFLEKCQETLNHWTSESTWREDNENKKSLLMGFKKDDKLIFWQIVPLLSCAQYEMSGILIGNELFMNDKNTYRWPEPIRPTFSTR